MKPKVYNCRGNTPATTSAKWGGVVLVTCGASSAAKLTSSTHVNVATIKRSPGVAINADHEKFFILESAKMSAPHKAFLFEPDVSDIISIGDSKSRRENRRSCSRVSPNVLASVNLSTVCKTRKQTFSTTTLNERFKAAITMLTALERTQIVLMA